MELSADRSSIPRLPASFNPFITYYAGLGRQHLKSAEKDIKKVEWIQDGGKTLFWIRILRPKSAFL